MADSGTILVVDVVLKKPPSFSSNVESAPGLHQLSAVLFLLVEAWLTYPNNWPANIEGPKLIHPHIQFFILKSLLGSQIWLRIYPIASNPCSSIRLPILSQVSLTARLGRSMSYLVRHERPIVRLVVHECRLGLSMSKWDSSVLVSHGYPGVLLAGSSLSRISGTCELASGNCRVIRSK